MLLVTENEVRRELHALGTGTIRFALSEAPQWQQDQRFEQVLERYFAAAKALEAPVINKAEITSLYQAVVEAAAMLRLLENEAASGYWINQQVRLQVTVLSEANIPTTSFSLLALPDAVLPEPPLNQMDAIPALAFVGTISLIVLLIRHRGPPAVFDHARSLLCEVQGLPLVQRAIPVGFKCPVSSRRKHI